MEYEKLIGYNSGEGNQLYLNSDWTTHFAKPDGSYKIGSDYQLMQKRRLVFKEGQQVRVQWPDESESIETINLIYSMVKVATWADGDSFFAKETRPAIFKKISGPEVVAKPENVFGQLRFAREDVVTVEDLEARV